MAFAPKGGNNECADDRRKDNRCKKRYAKFAISAPYFYDSPVAPRKNFASPVVFLLYPRTQAASKKRNNGDGSHHAHYGHQDYTYHV